MTRAGSRRHRAPPCSPCPRCAAARRFSITPRSSGDRPSNGPLGGSAPPMTLSPPVESPIAFVSIWACSAISATTTARPSRSSSRASDPPLAWGGRYDSLIGRFGRDLPAAGFALYVERLHVAQAEEERQGGGGG